MKPTQQVAPEPTRVSRGLPGHHSGGQLRGTLIYPDLAQVRLVALDATGAQPTEIAGISWVDRSSAADGRRRKSEYLGVLGNILSNFNRLHARHPPDLPSIVLGRYQQSATRPLPAAKRLD